MLFFLRVLIVSRAPNRGWCNIDELKKDKQRRDYHRGCIAREFQIIQLTASQIFAWNYNLLLKLFGHHTCIYSRKLPRNEYTYFANAYGSAINTHALAESAERRKWVTIRFVCISSKLRCRFWSTILGSIKYRRSYFSTNKPLQFRGRV